MATLRHGALFSIATLVAIIALVPFAPRTRGAETGKEVLVVNAPSQAVPTTLTSTASVRLENGSRICIDPACNGVRVVNTRDQPVPVHDSDDPAKRRAIYHIGLSGDNVSGVLPIPNNTRLVIENLNYFLTRTLDSTCTPNFTVNTLFRTGPEPSVAPHLFFPPYPNANGGNVFTRLYADAPEVTIVLGAPGGGTCDLFLRLTVEGYFVAL
jgi:hypothetical protein